MAVTKNNPSGDSADREIVMAREFEAPREMVWSAWTDPQHLGHWWGPRGFTITTRSIDVGPGGVWEFVMHGPDGTDYPNRITYREIVPPERLVYAHSGAADDEPGQFVTTVTFAAADGTTTVTMRAVFKNAAERDEVARKHQAIEGGRQTLERLGEHLAGMARPASTADREIRVSRRFHAPRELVWRAMTDPAHVVHWWGPRGFTTTVAAMDVRVGGIWKHTMHGPDGTNYPNQSVFREVEEPARLVYSHGGGREGGPGVSFVATWTFDEVAAGQTEVTIHMVFPTADDRDRVIREFGAFEGAQQTLERLGEQLPTMTTGREFVLIREIAAPRELVWQAWTEVAHLQRWFGPKGFTMRACSMDFRPGGVFHYAMKSPDGHEMWGKWLFLAIVPPERLVLINAFSDAQAGVTRHPLTATWPLQTRSTTTLTERDGRTTLTLRWVPYAATEEERRTFDGAHGGMEQGWKGTMDQLDSYLASLGPGT